MPGNAKVNGTWKELVGVNAKVNGSWKEVTEGYTKVNGTWQQWFQLGGSIFQEIASFTVSNTNTSSISFTNIDQSYEALYIAGSVKSRGTTQSSLNCRFNNNSSNVYDNFMASPSGGYAESYNSNFANLTPFLAFENVNQNDLAWSAFSMYLNDYNTGEPYKKFISRFTGGKRTDDRWFDGATYQNTTFGSSATISQIIFDIGDNSNFQVGSQVTIFGMIGN